MFGKNEIVGPAYFKNLADDELMITTTFFTLQGEGPFSGEPAIFVRLSKCNRNCVFCDTWFDSGDILKFDQILEKMINSLNTSSIGIDVDEYRKGLLVVVSGGEPMLQKNLGKFLSFLHEHGFRTQIESNGDMVRKDLPVETTLVVSPKANTNTGRYGDIRPDVFARANVLKFVVTADETDIHHEVPSFAYEFRKIKGHRSVYISPMNIYNYEPNKVGNNASLEMRSEVDERISFWTPGLLDQTKNQSNHEYAAMLAMKGNFTLQLQTHLYASLP